MRGVLKLRPTAQVFETPAYFYRCTRLHIVGQSSMNSRLGGRIPSGGLRKQGKAVLGIVATNRCRVMLCDRRASTQNFSRPMKRMARHVHHSKIPNPSDCTRLLQCEECKRTPRDDRCSSLNSFIVFCSCFTPLSLRGMTANDQRAGQSLLPSNPRDMTRLLVSPMYRITTEIDSVKPSGSPSHWVPPDVVLDAR